MITITFNGVINSDNIDLYRDIFNGETVNPIHDGEKLMASACILIGFCIIGIIFVSDARVCGASTIELISVNLRRVM